MTPRAGLDEPVVLAKAVEYVNEAGYDTLSLGELARRLHVRTPSLYNHIGGLPELKQRLALHGTGRLYAALASVAVGRSRDDALREICAAYRRFALDGPGLYEAMFRAPFPDDPELGATQREVVGVLLQVLRAYALTDEQAIHMVRAIRSALHGFVSIERSGGFRMAEDVEASFECLVEMVLSATNRRVSAS